MAASVSPYEEWLSQKLISLNPDVDGEVFVTYISGILDTDTSNEEKKESLEGIIAEVVSEGTEAVCEELIGKWEEINGQQNSGADGKCSVEDQLSEDLEHPELTVTKGRELTAEEKARKAAILAQYSQVSEGNDDSDSDDDPGGATGDADYLMCRNTNKADVDKTEREKRDKAKKESDEKREKDKQDREAQKAKAQDRKDTEKKRTQKGERRR
ncbi:LOW QUALITY PROTEIN: coiled-coil domain-containing protein 43-like [Haliotis rubra]|uniref:LOW QUALITY PROTEIN: coiled-coil domain-containing protein 43-like n=1 Tax=Haliotis rubra TaxID=36100 RepID=UPI001EE579DC|nr:LOW QUALITY PROTEIN: coiled-coil domain-containing protein 43-like [Haliotis rubra]